MRPHSTWLVLRWKVISRITESRKCIRNIARESRMLTVDPRAPMRMVDQAYGLWESFAILPTDLQAITIHGPRIEDHVYACGLGQATKISRFIL